MAVFSRALAALALLLFCASAQAQQAPSAVWTGYLPVGTTPITTSGYNINGGGSLYAPTSASLQAVTLPFTVAYNIQTLGGLNNLTQDLVDNRSGSPISFGLGFFNTNCQGCTSSAFPFQFSVGTTAFKCTDTGAVCTNDNPLNDGKWHSVCTIFTSKSVTLIVDGAQVDQYTTSGTIPYTPPTTYWNIGNIAVNGNNQSINLREYRVYTQQLLPSDCAQLGQLNAQNLAPTTGVLSGSMALYLPMGNCTTTPGGGCTDSSGNGNNFTNDQGGPTVAMTSPPPPGPTTITGVYNFTVNASDAIGVSQVSYAIVPHGQSNPVTLCTSTTTPFTCTGFNTALYNDGSYDITATATNISGVSTVSAPSTAVFSNGNASGNFYVRTAGSDTNCNGTVNVDDSAGVRPNCAWQTTSKASNPASKYLGFTTIHFQGGQTFTGSMTWTTTKAQGPLSIQDDGSGTCLVLGTNMGCPILSITSGGGNGIFMSNINGFTVQNFRILGTVGVTNPCSSFTTETNLGIFLDNSSGSTFNSTINNVEVKSFNKEVYIKGANNNYYGNVITNNWLHGVSSASCDNVGLMHELGVWNFTVSGNLIENIGSIAGTASGYFDGCCGNGFIMADGGGGKNQYSIDEFNVTRNFNANSTTCGSGAGNWTFGAGFVKIINNESYGGSLVPNVGACDGDGFDLDGGSNHNLVAYNYSHGNESGFTHFIGNVGSASWIANATVFNISENDGNGNAGNGGGGITVGANGASQNITSSIWSNNTIVNTNTGSQITAPLVTMDQNINLIIVNNIFYGTAAGALLFRQFGVGSSASVSNFTIDYNDWYRAAPCTSANPCFNVGNTIYNAFTDWQIGTGQDAHGISANPNFVGAVGSQGTCYTSGVPVSPQSISNCGSGSPYQLTTGSPAVNSGNPISNYASRIVSAVIPTTDYFGNPVPYAGHGNQGWNMGADGAFH